MNLTNTIMEAIEESLVEMMCSDCPHVEHSVATFYDPEWSECPGDGTPAEPGCRKHDEYLEIVELAKKFEMEVKAIIFGGVRVGY